MLLSELLQQNPELDHEIEIEDGDLVANLVSLVRLVQYDGNDMTDYLVMGAPDNTTGILQYGLVQSAVLQIENWMVHGDPND